MRILLNVSAATAFAVFGVNYVSYLISGRSFDESALYQLVYGFEDVNFAAFSNLIVLSVIALLICLVILLYFDRMPLMRRLNPWAKGVMSLLFLGYIVSSPVVTHSVPLITGGLGQTTEKTFPAFTQRYTRLGSVPDVKKNLVVLYLESFERTFLDQTLFPGLAPNMTALEQASDHFTEVAGLKSAGWTMGGLVASQCGVILTAPMGSNNAMGRVGSFLPEARCIGDLLHQQGYQLEFIGGAKKKFAGKDKFFRSHGFSSVSGLDDLVQPDEPVSEWGRYDDNTLDDVLERFDALSAAGTPFGLYALTLDTHPNGYSGPACAGMEYGEGKNRMLNAVHCNDKLVGDFLKKLQAHPAADETLIVVLSDHLALRNVADDFLDEGYRRNLFFILDGDTTTPVSVDRPGTALDVSASILDYLTEGQVQSFGLGRSLRQDSAETLLASAGGVAQLEDMIDGWREPLLSFWRLEGQFGSGIRVDAQKQVTVDELTIRYPVSFEVREGLVTNVSIDAAYDGFAKSFSDRQASILVDSCAGIYQFAALEDPPQGACYLSSNPSGDLSWGDLQTDVTYGDAVLFNPTDRRPETTDRIAFFAQTGTFEENFHVADALTRWGDNLRITSAGYNEARTFRASVALGNSVLTREFGRGVNVVSISEDNEAELIGTIDLCAGDHDRGKSISDMRGDLGERYIVLVLDSAHCSEPGALETVFRGTMLERWPEIEMRVPYIGVVDSGTTTELVGKAGNLLTVWNAPPAPGN